MLAVWSLVPLPFQTLSNLMKLWSVLCRATQEGQVMVENSDKMWSTGEGNDKPLQHSCPENPMNSMKDELPRLVAQYATGDQWRNNSRKAEELEPKHKQYPVVNMTNDGSKVWSCKKQYHIGPGMSDAWFKENSKWSNRRWQEWT